MGGRGVREFQITQWVFRTIRIFLHNSYNTIFSELLLAMNARLLQINTDYFTGALLSFCSHSHYNAFKVLSETLIFSTFP